MRITFPVLACCALLAACGGSTPSGPSTSPMLSRTRFLAFGDSMTSGEVTAPVTGSLNPPSVRMILVPAAAYPGLLQSRLTTRYTAQARAIVVANAGRSGEHPHEGTARFSDAFSAANPEVVLLMEGGNSLNLYGSDLPLEGLIVMVGEARSRGARVFLANLPPTRPGFRLSQPLVELLAINRKIEAMALAEDAVFVNVYDAMRPEVDSLIGGDGLHPTEAGYQRIADVFFAAIQANLEVQ